MALGERGLLIDGAPGVAIPAAGAVGGAGAGGWGVRGGGGLDPLDTTPPPEKKKKKGLPPSDPHRAPRDGPRGDPVTTHSRKNGNGNVAP